MHARRLIMVPVNKKTFKLTAANVISRVTPRTAVIVASSPTYPHGIIDDIADISNVALRCRVCMHVDACLGAFVLPFMRQQRYEVPAFDFSLPGVTSMTADTHKYGLAHKGTSVVLYRTKALRRAQFTPVTEWSGGLYVSPGLSGSRCVIFRLLVRSCVLFRCLCSPALDNVSAEALSLYYSSMLNESLMSWLETSRKR